MERKDFSIDVVWSDGDKDKSIQALANVGVGTLTSKKLDATNVGECRTFMHWRLRCNFYNENQNCLV